MHENVGGEEHLAPVIPLFGGDRSAAADAAPTDATTGSRSRVDVARAELAHAERAAREHHPHEREHASIPEPDAADVRAQAEQVLVRKLRAKQLSVSEARTVLRQADLDRDAVEDVIDEFEHRGYLDDRTLASLLVTSGVERKGQGRVALARSLSQRGIPRDIIAETLEELPDDDDERALEFARSKVSGMTGLEYDTALRRLHGQLARRGYGGSAAMNAARTALDEVGLARSAGRFSRPTHGVRFTESD